MSPIPPKRSATPPAPLNGSVSTCSSAPPVPTLRWAASQYESASAFARQIYAERFVFKNTQPAPDFDFPPAPSATALKQIAQTLDHTPPIAGLEAALAQGVAELSSPDYGLVLRLLYRCEVFEQAEDARVLLSAEDEAALQTHVLEHWHSIAAQAHPMRGSAPTTYLEQALRCAYVDAGYRGDAEEVLWLQRVSAMTGVTLSQGNHHAVLEAFLKRVQEANAESHAAAEATFLQLLAHAPDDFRAFYLLDAAKRFGDACAPCAEAIETRYAKYFEQRERRIKAETTKRKAVKRLFGL